MFLCSDGFASVDLIIILDFCSGLKWLNEEPFMLNLLSLLKIADSFVSVISLRYYFNLSFSIKFKISLYSLELPNTTRRNTGDTYRSTSPNLHSMQSNYLPTLAWENFKLHSFKHLYKYNYIQLCKNIRKTRKQLDQHRATQTENQ